MKCPLYLIGLFFTFNLVCISCQKTSVEDHTDLIQIHVKEPYVELINLSEIASEIKIVPLQATMESIFGEITRIRVVNDRIYILDIFARPGLYVFDLEGTFLFSLNTLGNGPGEFTSIFDFVVIPEKNQIIVKDLGAFKKVYFNLEGQYQYDEIVKLRPETFFYAGNDIFYYFMNSSMVPDLSLVSMEDFDIGSIKELPQEYDNIRVVKDGKVINSYLPYQVNIHGGLRGLTHDNFNNQNNTVYFQKTYNDTLYTITEEALTPIAIIRYGKPIDYAVFDEHKTATDGIQYINTVQPMYDAHRLQFISDSIISMNYAHRGNRFGFFDLETENSIIIRELKNDINSFPIQRYPIAGNDNTLVFSSTVRYNESLEQTTEQCCMSQEAIQNLRSFSSEIDNPILVFVELDLEKVNRMVNSDGIH